MKYPILFFCTSLVSSESENTPSQCLCSSFCHSSLSSVNFPSTCSSDNGFLCISWHQTAFNQVIRSGFPRLFLEHSSFGDFLCTLQLLLHVFSHSQASVSRLSLCRFLCCEPHYPQHLQCSFESVPRFLLDSHLSSSSQLSGLQFLLLHPVHFLAEK